MTPARPDAARVAVCSRSFSNHPTLRELLLARYPDAWFNDRGLALRGDALVEFLGDAERAVVGMERVDAALLERVPRLRVVAKYGVGLDGLDLRAMAARGIELGWRAGVNANAVAELTVSHAIALLRGLPGASAALRSGAWSPCVGRELGECTVGLIGCGNIGRRVVSLLAPFGPTLLAHDRVEQPEFYRAHGVTACGLDELLQRSDLVSLHVPLDDSTRGMLSARRLDQMRAGACLINTARGGLVDEAHLAALLRSGRLGGAAFDVFADEPALGNELVGLSNFLGTPHLAGSSARAVLAMGRAAIDGLGDHRPATEFLAP